jgi:hypothetical protein
VGVVSRYHENSVEMRITEIFFSIRANPHMPASRASSYV